MAILNILHFPDPQLRLPGEPISQEEIATPEFQALIDDMFETMYDARGVGLAATQVNIQKAAAVMQTSADKSECYVIINPEILESRNIKGMQEGCLSVPGAYDTVPRAEWVKMRALDRHGKPFELEAEGLLAECIQHEIDHLKGKLFIDYLSPLKRERILKKAQKLARQQS